MSQIFKLWVISLKQYLLICLFASHPGQVPRCSPCLVLTVVAYFLIAALLLVTHQSYFSLLAQVVIEIVLLSLVAFVALKIRRKLERLHQTISALIGTNMIVTAVSAIILLWLAPELIEGETDQISPTLVNLTLLILVWNLAVTSLIFKRAMQIRTFSASLIAIIFFLIYEFLVIGILQLK